ncbi:unnamed protein product, partial [marine sediment metagenome]
VLLSCPADCKVGMGYVKDCLLNLCKVAYRLINKHPSVSHYGVPYFLWHYTIEEAESEPLTWETIIAAWIDATADGRLMTILTLDELRREAWNKEFTSYRIAPPAVG